MDKEGKIITKIEAQKRNKDRVNIYVNDEYLLSCSTELIYSHSLSKGKVIDINYLHELVSEDNFIKCKNKALKIIEKTYKTEKQISDKLIEKEFDEKTIERTMEFLRQYNFVDDEKYVEMYVKDKINSWGKNKIKYELIKKGISEELIRIKLINIDSAEEQNIALKLAEKKYKIISKSESDNRKLYKKLGDYLIRTGYDLETTNRVLDKVVKKELNSLDKNKREDKRKNEDIQPLYELAQKRYSIIIKSECDSRKIYKKLSDFLLRRGYTWEDIKSTLNSIMTDFDI